MGDSFCRIHRNRRAVHAQQGFIAGLLLVVLLIFSVLIWLLTTTSGALMVLQSGIALTGSGQVQGVEGSIAQGLRIRQLDYRNAALDLALVGFELRVDWLQLRERHLHVPVLRAEAVRIDWLAEPEADTNEAADPVESLAWPELPVTLSLDELALGSLQVSRKGETLPVRFEALRLQFAADAQRAQLVVEQLDLHGMDAQATVSGEITGVGSVPMGVDAGINLAVEQSGRAAQLHLTARGNLEHLLVSLNGLGEGLSIEAHAAITPFSPALPLQHLSAQIRGLNPSAWISDLPDAQLNLDALLELDDSHALAHQEPAAEADAFALDTLQLHGRLTIQEGSHWQKQRLAGGASFYLDRLRLPQVNIDLSAGKNRVRIAGALGNKGDELRFDVQLPQPAAVWPGLEGSGDLKGSVRGSLEQHELTLSARLDLPPAWQSRAAVRTDALKNDDEALDLPAALRQGPVQIELQLGGGYAAADPAHDVPENWQGRVTRLRASNPEVSATLEAPVEVRLQFAQAQQPMRWSVGATQLLLRLPGKRQVLIRHAGSSGSGMHWRSAGSIEDLVPAWVVAQLPRAADPLRVAVQWDLAAEPALAGSLRVTRRRGDIYLPGSPPLALGLKQLDVQLVARAEAGNRSSLNLQALIEGNRVGRLSVSGNTTVVTQSGLPIVSEQERVQLDVNLNVTDLGWISAIVGDETELGGRIEASARFTRVNGVWNATGTITGDDLRIVRVDDGIRLINGTLRGRFTDTQVVIDSLRFPSVIRSTPRNSQVRAWIRQYGDQGSVEATGSWSLETAEGSAEVRLSRFPVVQRADRFIAGSGEIRIEVTPRRMSITGKLQADAGWISLEGAEDLPTLDSDVVVMKHGEVPASDESLPWRMDVEVSLGQNVYLTGLGLSTGLEGEVRIRNTRSGLRANGTVHTRGGEFSIYGQTLVVDHGAVTFQGPLDDPLLDIVAIRKGLQVEAGVQISGTARDPIITLVSYPDVPDVEKVSWLLLGRGPAASGADVGMLVSAAASFLRGDDSTPLHEEFGLDELGIRSGTSLAGRGILPEQTVVGDIKNLAESGSEANQFLVLGKRLTEAIYLTFEQALSGRESIVRASYRITETLSASLRIGTVSGLDLVWSFVFDD